MQINYHNQYSNHLQKNMEYKIYGHKGKPVLVFPTSCGRFFQYEDSGMIHALSKFIDDGKIQVWTVDSIDGETFFCKSCDRIKSVKRHEQYFAYINNEIIPSILRQSAENNGSDQQLILTGCSMGAFHAANFYFRNPWFTDTVIALSGVYSTDYFFGDYKPQEIYCNSPVDYLKTNNDARYLERFRHSNLIFCCGQGAYEEPMLKDTRVLQQIFEEHSIAGWFDYWGTDVVHDWPWWQKQVAYFFGKVLE